MNFVSKVRKHAPLIVLLVYELVLFIQNFTPGTILAGWDNIMPEFNLSAAFTRSIFGTWLEYRGPGLLDGMSHIANLVHTITISILSLALPQELLRYVFIFGMHLVGGIGAYLLLLVILQHTEVSGKKWLSAAGSLFYLLNLATIQMFYAPLEGFVIHFAALPWLAWSLLTYLARPKKQTLIIFLIISIISTPQFFVTPLLAPIAILLASISLITLAGRPHLRKHLLIAGGGFLAVNAFWLLPYVYSIPRNAPVILTAKINQMSSGDVFERNKAFGDLTHTMTFQGFSLDYEDMNADRVFSFMMAPWRTHIAYPLTQMIMGGIIGITLIGLWTALRKPKQPAMAFAVTALVSFVFLGNDIPYVRDVTMWLQGHLPFFKEAFRFPYTKFSLLYALSNTVLFSIGLAALRKRLILVCAFAAVLFVAVPAFQGNFLYTNLRVRLPTDYTDLFAYMKTQDPDGRVAVLPQQAYWSWKFYDFGYRGSGFLWHGLGQPTMDRAFDPWSAASENYFWELSYALYTKNPVRIESVLSKYNVRYLLLDEHIISADNARSLFIDETKALFRAIPTIRQLQTFGKLTVYERSSAQTNSFISMAQNLPTVNAYSWTDNDAAYGQFGNYITGPNPSITYPFRSLLTKRAVSEREFDVRTILPYATPVYDSTKSADLISSYVKECGLLKDGSATASVTNGTLQFKSLNQRGCLSFDIPTLSHKFGYLVSVESTNVTGRPLMISFINDTARHVELETFLGGGTDYFILPPLARDGLGYTVYISNDSIGKYETVNDLSRIRMYQIPYEDMVSLHTGNQSPGTRLTNVTVSHPNPAWYKVVTDETGTLILSQSYDDGWIAWSKGNILPHVKVNNWENGWSIDPGTTGTIYIFFWPQMLEFLGFVILPIPFIIAFKQKK